MRTSQIALLSAGGALVAGVVVISVIGRIGLLAVEAGERPDLGARVTREMALDGFSSIVVRGSWELDLARGDAFEVELEFPEGIEDSLDIDVQGDRLLLDSEDSGPAWSWFGEDLDLNARIVMPALSGLEIEGSGRIELDGFSGERLDLDVAGAAYVAGEMGRYDELRLDVSGAGRVDLVGMEFHDADVNLSGASSVALTMAGGVLSGVLSGVGNIEYYGTVEAERVNISGLGSVGPAN